MSEERSCGWVKKNSALDNQHDVARSTFAIRSPAVV